MTKSSIHRILVQFRALSWAAKELNVNKGTLLRFLAGERPATKRQNLREDAEHLANKLLATDGNAKNDVDGKSVKAWKKEQRKSKGSK